MPVEHVAGVVLEHEDVVDTRCRPYHAVQDEQQEKYVDKEVAGVYLEKIV